MAAYTRLDVHRAYIHGADTGDDNEIDRDNTMSMESLREDALHKIVMMLRSQPAVEGAFLGGSLANEDKDEYADIDLGIAAGNSDDAMNAAWALRDRIIRLVGAPAHVAERSWDHCRMTAVLYSRTQFAPIGLELDLIVSRLEHVGEQMPYSEYQIIFDRAGQLNAALDKQTRFYTRAVVERMLSHHLNTFPFHLHAALKAHLRGDAFDLQSQLEEMRKLLYQAAAVREKALLHGSRRASRYLSPAEQHIVEQSFIHPSRESIQRMAEAYSHCLNAVRARYQMNLEHFHAAMRATL
jgi:predicted nucleotidyltransferase